MSATTINLEESITSVVDRYVVPAIREEITRCFEQETEALLNRIKARLFAIGISRLNNIQVVVNREIDRRMLSVNFSISFVTPDEIKNAVEEVK